jgi:hypothetical protein
MTPHTASSTSISTTCELGRQACKYAIPTFMAREKNKRAPARRKPGRPPGRKSNRIHKTALPHKCAYCSYSAAKRQTRDRHQGTCRANPDRNASIGQSPLAATGVPLEFKCKHCSYSSAVADDRDEHERKCPEHARKLLKWSKQRLQGALRELGLSTKGYKRVLVDRLLGQETSIDDYVEAELVRDVGKTKEDYPSREVAMKTIALSLVCTASFHEAMGGCILDAKAFYPNKHWLGNIYLPGRYKRWPDYESWHAAFLADRVRIIQMAQDMYNELPDNLRVKSLAYVVAPTPPTTVDALEVRQDIFRYQEMRRRLLHTRKLCSQQQYLIKKEKSAEILGDPTPQQQDVLEKLYHLQETASECQQVLEEGELEATIVSWIDGLLSRLDKTMLAAPASLPTLQETAKRTYQEAIELLRKKHDFNPVLNIPGASPKVFARIFRARPKAEEQDSNRREPVDATLWSHGSLQDIGRRLTNRLHRLRGSLDFDRFATNLRYFLGIQARLPHLEDGQDTWQGRAHNTVQYGARRTRFRQAKDIESFDLLHDNVYHAARIFSALVQEASGLPSHVDVRLEQANKTWLRMLAVIAIYYGGIYEPGYILSVVDRLLSDLARCFRKSRHGSRAITTDHLQLPVLANTTEP